MASASRRLYTQVIKSSKILEKPHPALWGIPHARCYNGGNPNARYLRRETLLQYWLRNALALLIKEREGFWPQHQDDYTHKSSNHPKFWKNLTLPCGASLTPGATTGGTPTPDTYGGKPSCSTGSATHWLSLIRRGRGFGVKNARKTSA